MPVSHGLVLRLLRKLHLCNPDEGYLRACAQETAVFVVEVFI